MSALYDSGREGFLAGELSWTDQDVRVMLVKASYVFDASHVYVSDMGDADNGRSSFLSGKTKTAGVADADDVSIFADQAEATNGFVLFQDTGNDGTSRLIAFVDVPQFLPAPLQRVNTTFDNGPSKIFKL